MKRWSFFLLYILWISYVEAQERLSLDDFIVQHYTTADGLPSNYIYLATQDEDGYLWIATDNGLSRFDGRNFKNYYAKDGLKGNMITAVKRQGRLIYAASFRGMDFIYKSKILNTSILPPISGTHMVFDYIIRDSIFRIVALSMMPNNYFIQYDYHISKDNQFSLMRKDSWIPIKQVQETEFKSLDQLLSVLHWSIQTYLSNDNRYLLINYQRPEDVNKNDSFVSTLYTYPSLKILDEKIGMTMRNYVTLLYGHQITITKSDLKQAHIYRIEENQMKLKTIIDIPDEKINSCNQINSNTYFVTTHGNGLYILTRKNHILQARHKKFIPYSEWVKKISPILEFGCMKSVTPISSDTVIITSCGGFYLYHTRAHRFLFKTRPFSILNRRFYSAYLDKNQKLYLGGLDGLYESNLKGEFLDKIPFAKKSDYKINSIAEDHQGNLWISTGGNGIFVYNKITKKSQELHVSNGLLSEDNFKIIIDAQDRKWISSNQGIQVWDGKYRYTIDQSEGIVSNEIEDFTISGDTAWIYTNKGNTTYLYQLDTSHRDIPLMLNEVIINARKLDSLPPILNPDETDVEFHFIGIHYSSPSEILYQYRLIRNEDVESWKYTKNPHLIFSNLAHGRYKLEIQAFYPNHPNAQSERKVYTFEIKQHFYKSWWFYVLITAMIFLVVIYMIYMRNKQKLDHEVYTRELSQLKLEALKAEMNPHFIFNALNSIKEAMMNHDFDASQGYLSKLAKLIRHALYNTKSDWVELKEELKFIDLYVELEQLRFDHKFDYIKDIKDSTFEDKVPTMILQPFFENAIRHGKIGQLSYQGKLYFSAQEVAGMLVLIIRDNGLGISKSQEVKDQSNSDHKSMALQIIKERIELYKKTHDISINLYIRELENEEYRTEVRLEIESIE